ISYQQLSDFLLGIGAKAGNNKGIVAKLFAYLSATINEMVCCKIPVFVEVLEDLAYIKTYMELMGVSDEFRRYGLHLINADKKSNIIEPLAVAHLLGMDSFVVYDSDTNVPEDQHHYHKPDNKKLLTIQGHNAEDE